MATEHIPQVDKLFKDYGKRFRENARKANEILEQVGEAIKKYRESEEKSMLHNVTVKHEENKVIKESCTMIAKKEIPILEFINLSNIPEEYIPKIVIKDVQAEALDHEPTPHEIAKFLSDSKADFVSVVQNYRFENELPFC